MKYLKSYEQFSVKINNLEILDENADYTKELEILEGIFGTGKNDEQKKEELKKLLENSKATTLKTLIDKALDNKKLDIDRILKIVKNVFMSSQGWMKNQHKYAFFKDVATEAINKNDDTSWNKLIGLFDFALKSGPIATPAWSEDKKVWVEKTKSGSAGL